MNNEIKEILDRLDYNEWEVDLYKVPITWCEMYDIRDYITNLQTTVNNCKQENERKDRLIEEYKEGIIAYADRNEKAIEYIKQQNVYYGFCDNLLNILQNGSKDE